MEDLKRPQEVFAQLKSRPQGLSTAEAVERKAKYGSNAITEKELNPFLKLIKNFWGPIPWMIEVAAIFSLIVRHYADFWLILFLLAFNACVTFWQEYQAGNAVKALKKKLAITSRVLRDGSWHSLSAVDLVPGDVVRLRMGDVVPADIVLFEGAYLSVDQSALTGESLPVSKGVGNLAYSGSIVQKGEMDGVVVATGLKTYFGTTASLVAKARPVSHLQVAVVKIGQFLIYACLVLVGILMVHQLFAHVPVLQLLKISLVLIVASIPVALPAVLTVTMSIGALSLAKKKAIVTRLESIEEMAGVDVLCSDKTGTLTYNKIIAGKPRTFGSHSEEEVLRVAALASRASDLDPLDSAILDAAHSVNGLTKYEQKTFTPFDPENKRTEAVIVGPDGKEFLVTKGAPQVVLGMCSPQGEVQNEVRKVVEELAVKGNRALGVAVARTDVHWEFLGIIPLFDQIRDDAKETIDQAARHGILTKMVTGDNVAIAREVSRELGLGDHILTVKNGEPAKELDSADGFAQVFPVNKYSIVRGLQSRGHIVGMTGDGVNDAPALRQADLGIAVSGAADAARAAASIVLTAPGLSVIVGAIEMARQIFERMTTYAIYRIAETVRIMLFMVLSIMIYHFYPITVLMMILLAVLNDVPIMAIAYDNTVLPPKPVRWDLRRVISTAGALGVIGVLSSFLLLVLCDTVLHIDPQHIQSIIFLKLSVAGHMTLFVVRSRSAFWSPPYPAPTLLGAILFTQFLATLLVWSGIFVPSIPLTHIALIWVYASVWMVFADVVKRGVYRYLGKSPEIATIP